MPFSFLTSLHCLPSSPTISSSMASKRRRKTGLTRMDAALDQMSSFGFSRQLVRKTVRNLLKVYGDDGWIFIEEGGYKVLLGVLLDGQDTTEETQSLLQDAASEIDSTGTELVTAESYEVAAEGISFNDNNNASSTNHTGSGNKECWKDIGLDETTVKSPFDSGDNHSANGVNPQCSEDSPVLESALATADTPVNVPIGRHKPCYGWISDDDDCDEEPKFIALTPAN